MIFDEQFTIKIANINEAPIFVGATSFTVEENVGVDSIVGTISSVDPDNEANWVQNVTYIMKNDSGTGPLALTGQDLVTATMFNFEVKSSYVVNVVARDTGIPPAETIIQITINVEDVNDAPSWINFSSKGVAEGSPADTVVGTFVTEDEDLEQNHTYSIVSSTDGTSRSHSTRDEFRPSGVGFLCTL